MAVPTSDGKGICATRFPLPRTVTKFVSLPLVGHMPGVFPETYQLEEKRRRFSYLLDRAREIVAAPTIGLVLLHLPPWLTRHRAICAEQWSKPAYGIALRSLSVPT